MSLTPIPPSPQESAPLVKIFCLTGHKINGPLPTGLKFKKQVNCQNIKKCSRDASDCFTIHKTIIIYFLDIHVFCSSNIILMLHRNQG